MIIFEGILSKTASYLTKQMQNARTGSDEARLTVKRKSVAYNT